MTTFDGVHYHVKYDDGDSEDLSEDEMLHAAGVVQERPYDQYLNASPRDNKATGSRKTAKPKAAAVTGALAMLEVNAKKQAIQSELGRVGITEEDVALITPIFEQCLRVNAQLKARCHVEGKKTRALETKTRRLQQQIVNTYPGIRTHVPREAREMEVAGASFESDRTEQRHVKEMEDLLLEKYKGNPVRAVQVANGIADRFGVLYGIDPAEYKIDGRSMTKQELDICVSLGLSFRMWGARILQAFPSGRFPNQIRTLVRAARQAGSLESPAGVPCVGAGLRARFLHSSKKMLLFERRRFQAWADGGDVDSAVELLTLRGKRRSDAHPKEWRSFIVTHWKHPDITRRSEKARDCYVDKEDRTKLVPCFLLETRQGVALKAIHAAAKSQFHKDFEYDDGGQRDFKCSLEFIRKLRPWNVKMTFGDRETSLCRYHMQWEFIANALWVWQKGIRDAGLVPKDMPMTIPRDAYDLRKLLVCPRDNEGDEYDKPKCRDEDCDRCKDLRLLVGWPAQQRRGLLSDEEMDLGKNHPVKWERWEEYENTRGDKKHDFASKTGVVADLFDELRRVLEHKAAPKPTIWQFFKEHHDLMKYMWRNKAHTRRNFPHGHVHVICDFSENGAFVVKREHQSRYYETFGYTLHGMVVDSHIDDRKDIVDTEKDRLKAVINKANGHDKGPWIITDMHCVLSEDTVHDPAAVMHYVGKVLMPILIENVEGLKNKGVAHFTLDGAPTQYDNKDMYHWVSWAHHRFGVLVDWVIGCAAHNKDLSDGECGLFKNSITRVNLEWKADAEDGSAQQTQIKDVPAAVRWLRHNMTFPQKDLAQKNGKGIHRRIFHHVPLKAINRRLPAVRTLSGSKVKHQFVCVRRTGSIMWRTRPCHRCDCCMECDYRRIPEECAYKDICGVPEVKEMRVDSSPSLVLTRSMAEKNAQSLGGTVSIADFVVCEASADGGDLPDLPFYILEVLDEPCAFDKDQAASCCGLVKRGDTAYRVRQWMPMENGGGSSVYQWTGKIEHVPVSSTRMTFTRADANKTHFKLARRSRATCSNDHKLLALVKAENVCDMCEKTGTAFGCHKQGRCDYDLCTECEHVVGTRRRLDKSTKLSIYSHLPNVDYDPFEGQDGGTAWSGIYTCNHTCKLRDVAIHLKVSLAALIVSNDDIGLDVDSVLRQGTTLNMPGRGRLSGPPRSK